MTGAVYNQGWIGEAQSTRKCWVQCFTFRATLPLVYFISRYTEVIEVVTHFLTHKERTVESDEKCVGRAYGEWRRVQLWTSKSVAQIVIGGKHIVVTYHLYSDMDRRWSDIRPSSDSEVDSEDEEEDEDDTKVGENKVL